MSEEALQKREELKLKAYKIKEQKEKFKKREMKLADKPTDEVTMINERPEKRKKRIEKEAEKEAEDNFFLDEDAEIEEDEFTRIVDKSGKVIKIEDKTKPKRSRYEEDKEVYEPKIDNSKIHRGPKDFKDSKKGRKPAKAQPMKIKARSYRVNTANLAATKKKVHVKF